MWGVGGRKLIPALLRPAVAESRIALEPLGVKLPCGLEFIADEAEP